MYFREQHIYDVMTIWMRGQILIKWISQAVLFNEKCTDALELPYIVSIITNGSWEVRLFESSAILQ